nr:ATP-binding protein [Acetonema longum]
MLWGILTFILPFSFAFLTWINLASGILRLAVATGTLIVHFEKTRADLFSKETQYRLLAENAVDVIYRCRLSPYVKLEYISPAILAVTGYSPDEWYADPKLFMKVVHPDDLPLFKNYIKDCAKANSLPFTFRLIRKDQNIVWVEQRWVLIQDPQGNSLVIEGIVRDVTARKELEQIAARMDRMNMVGQMAVSVAHEIRNPLTTVRGYLQLLGMTREGLMYKERYDLLIEELDRTNEIISEYLMLAKDKVANLKRCSLNTIIQTLSPLIQANAAAANVYTKFDLGEISSLYLDEHEIRQLLLNLVRNAIEAMPAGGELTICTSSEGNQVTLAISDQGSGIPSHILDNLGMPFLTTKENGTGLGLPICYQIATRHQATIQVKTSDRGTTFFVYFNQPPAKENFALPQSFGVGRISRIG